MGKRPSTLALVLVLGASTLGGCSRQDTECLRGIGRKILDRASNATAGIRQKLDGLRNSAGGLDNLQDKVTLRLRWEKLLADVPIEVVVNGQEIELKGTVKTAEQRTRAVELAESTTGVQRVLVSLTIGDPLALEKRAE